MAIANAAEFYNLSRSARRVLVVELGFLGDAVHLLPALWEIRRNYPQAELHLLSSTVGCAVVGLTSCVDVLHPLRMGWGDKSVREHIRVLWRLRQCHFDVAINLNPSDRTILVTGLIRARWRLGCLGGRQHFWNRWCIDHWIEPSREDAPMFELHRQALASAGFTLGGAPTFGLEVPAAAVNWARELVPEGALHVSLCSTIPMKEWPVARHVALLHGLLQEDPELTVVMSASANPREQARLESVAEEMDSPRVKRLPAQLSIGQLAAVLSRCRVHLGPDSGVIHLALALGVPTVSYFRQRGGYREWMPRGDSHETLLVPCSCDDDRTSPCQRRGIPDCLAALTEEKVAGRLRRFLRGPERIAQDASKPSI